jgi:hypothetical protein
MKKVILLIMFLPYLASGQIVDDFESGNLINWIQSTEGRWKADTTESISGNFSLHHVFDNPSSGSDCIGLPLINIHPAEGMTKWTFLLRHGYDPSASNNWVVYLMTDADPISFAGGELPSGYAIGVNLTGYDDTLRLWKIKKGSLSIVATCPVNWQNNIGTLNVSKIIVERTSTGSWSVSIYDHNNNLKGTGSGTDNELFNPSWLILNYRYTSTRDRLLWFDNLKIEGVFYEDKLPPEIISYNVSGNNSLEINLSEEPSDEIMLLSNYSINNSGELPVRIEKESATSYLIVFQNQFNNKIHNTLVINILCDKSGNCKENASVLFTPVWADPGDIIISEIMADPVPVVSLPGKEYLEIYNRTEFSFNLKDWRLSTESQNTTFPSVNFDPGSFIILCSVTDTLTFSEYGKAIGLKSFPALTDEGRIIYLSDNHGNMIHGLEYSSEWYRNDLKKGGGWSLEMIDTDFPFFTEGNWEASSSRKGGTPGLINSVSRSNPDPLFHGIKNVFPEDSLTINIQFSETVFTLFENIEKITIGEDPVSSIKASDPLMRQFSIKPVKPLTKGKVYSLNIPDDVTDFAGNSITRYTFKFGLPEAVKKGDIVFNELLFNPYTDDPDYVELYNCSDKVLDASKLYLASIDSETGDTSEIKQVTADGRCIVPGAFYTVTTDREKVISRYISSDPENIFNTAGLPSMPDDKGHLLLLNRELDLIDEVIYSDDMHFSLLAEDEGVSLEKIRPEISSDESSNWHSASESSGWGTPGTQNSVFSPGSETGDRITFSSGKISPDNDGYEDVLVIDFNLDGIGNVVSVTIFDETGGYVRKISENLFAGSQASVIWDGTAADGSLVRRGIYIIFIELYNDKGKTKSWKKVCTVIR